MITLNWILICILTGIAGYLACELKHARKELAKAKKDANAAKMQAIYAQYPSVINDPEQRF